MAHVLNECRGRVRCDDDHPPQEDHDDGVGEVRGEETIPTERLALVELETGAVDGMDGAFILVKAGL